MAQASLLQRMEEGGDDGDGDGEGANNANRRVTRGSGLQQNVIDAHMPVVSYSSKPGEASTSDEEYSENLEIDADAESGATHHDVECQICLIDFQDGDEIRALPCRHQFHTECVDPWFRGHTSCPACRHDLSTLTATVERTSLVHGFDRPLSGFFRRLLYRGGRAGVDIDERSLNLLRAWWIDPLLATAGFGLAIHLYLRQERKLGLAYYEPFPGVMTQSLAAYWIGIMMWKAFVPPPAPSLPDGIPVDCRSLLYLMWEVVSGIVLYDFLIFFWHWASHEIPFLRSFHQRHHNSPRPGQLGSRDVLRHSLADGTMQVLINILVQRRVLLGGPVKSRVSRAVHNVVVTWMLTESHTASVEPRVFRRLGWLFQGIRDHRGHHLHHGRTPNEYHPYQQFFGYLDSIRWNFTKGEKHRNF